MARPCSGIFCDDARRESTATRGSSPQPSDFPGLNRYWVSVDGPYNEHLVRDVGGLYLALALAGVLTLLWRDGRSMLVLGAAWAIFSALHLGYHVDHLDALDSTADKVGEVAALSGSLVLALVLVLFPRRLRA